MGADGLSWHQASSPGTLARMRPQTLITIAILLLVIVGALVIQLVSAGNAA